MTIKELINKYKVEKAFSVITENKATIIDTLNQLSDALLKGVPYGMHGNEEVQWQKELKEVTDISSAMLAFYEMSLRGINKLASSKLAFYYASKIISENKFPNDVIISAYVIRSVVIFNNMDNFLDFARWAKEDYYSGDLDNTQFFDLLLLANVYSGWINPLGSPQFEKMKQQATNVASNHQGFDKSQIIREGLMASESIEKLFAHALQNSSFPIVPEGCI